MGSKHVGENTASFMGSLIPTIQHEQPRFLHNELQKTVGKSVFFPMLIKEGLLCLKNRNKAGSLSLLDQPDSP